MKKGRQRQSSAPWRKACAAVALSAPNTPGPATTALADRNCLDNAGALTVPAGGDYTDPNGTWTCEPGNPAATVGGWVLRPNDLAPSPTATVAAAPAPPTKSPASTASLPVFMSSWPFRAGAAAACVAALGGVIFAIGKLRAPALSGTLRMSTGQRVDLSAHGRRASIGENGAIKVGGQQVAARHATLRAHRDGSVRIGPLDGDVWVERRGLRQLVRQPRQLADGDVLALGDTTFTYHNLAAARPAPEEKSRPAWMA